MKQIGLLDESNRLKKLNTLGDPLEKLNNVIERRMFEEILNRVFTKEHKGAGGRSPYSYLLLFKILILQRLFNVSDDQAEYQINDRVSLMRFLGLALGNPVPDAKTVRLFRDPLVKADSQALVELLDKKDKVLNADSAYSGDPIAKQLPEGIENQIHEKGYRNKPLSDEQKAENKRKSRIRVRIEHVFGYMTGTMRGMTVRSIGIARERFNIGLTKLVYNLCRYEILSRELPVTG